MNRSYNDPLAFRRIDGVPFDIAVIGLELNEQAEPPFSDAALRVDGCSACFAIGSRRPYIDSQPESGL